MLYGIREHLAMVMGSQVNRLCPRTSASSQAQVRAPRSAPILPSSPLRAQGCGRCVRHSHRPLLLAEAAATAPCPSASPRLPPCSELRTQGRAAPGRAVSARSPRRGAAGRGGQGRGKEGKRRETRPPRPAPSPPGLAPLLPAPRLGARFPAPP